MALLLSVFVFVFVTVLVCVSLGQAFLKSRQSQQLRSMLRNAEPVPVTKSGQQLLRPAEAEDALTRLLARFKPMSRLALILEQSGTNVTTSKLIMRSLLIGLIGVVIGYKVHLMNSPGFSACAIGIFAASIPLLLVLRKRKKNIAAFEEQFPEALDFISRSMRVGHGFSTALEMLAADSPDPLGSAFRKVSNDLQLGSTQEAALKRLTDAVPLVDVRFFVSSVLLQQETGGNLGEILGKLSGIIRERFRLKGHVKAASSHGRITGLVLILMPVVVTVLIMMSNPEYLTGMAAQKIGRILIYGAILGQIVGYLAIKKITNIKV